MMELQSKFEVISVTDGDFTAQKVRLDGFAPKRCPEMANPFNSEIFRNIFRTQKTYDVLSKASTALLNSGRSTARSAGSGRWSTIKPFCLMSVV